jgi:hypothetical protein
MINSSDKFLILASRQPPAAGRRRRGARSEGLAF